MKALVTGGAGFIGSHLVNRLLEDGHDVVVVDNLSSGTKRLGYIEAAELHRVDIRDDAASKLIRDLQPEVVFHLAAQMDVRHSVADPIHDAAVNIVGSLNLLESARQAGSRFVFTSSGGCVYGEPTADLLPISESVQGTPTSPYGISKRILHDYLAFYENTYGMSTVVLALGNVYGPRQDPHGEAGVVAIFGSALLEGRQCRIFGEGKQTRDFVYVSDVVDAFVAAVRSGEGEVVNIGTGEETSVEELYQQMAKLAGVDAPPRYEPPRAGELQRSCLDIAKAAEVLGWRPKVDLEDGLRETLESIREELT